MRSHFHYGPRDEGYRYVRQYQTKHGPRWALWQREGGRNRRVGTATSEREYLTFLRLPSDFPRERLRQLP